MVKKIILSFILVLLSLFSLKVGVDVCLPYRGSAVFPLLESRNNFFCKSLASWDQAGRMSRTRIFEVLAVPMSQMDKDALNPSTVGWGDLILFWRIPLIIPLILEQVPENSMSTTKLLCFSFSATLFLALLIHYISLIFKAINEVSSPRTRGERRSPDEQRVASLMGRSNSSNNIVTTKKRD